jgi:hypothetical protein
MELNSSWKGWRSSARKISHPWADFLENVGASSSRNFMGLHDFYISLNCSSWSSCILYRYRNVMVHTPKLKPGVRFQSEVHYRRYAKTERLAEWGIWEYLPLCEIWGSYDSVFCRILKCYAGQSTGSLPTFLRDILPPSSRRKYEKLEHKAVRDVEMEVKE